ncbi:uncharacterized protein [Palaemon carinicauda]|uniref:uncharacterized protein n=1 Tax=Palaemon carinicauda TaxID=392227 RepID=UPI0035B5E124
MQPMKPISMHRVKDQMTHPIDILGELTSRRHPTQPLSLKYSVYKGTEGHWEHHSARLHRCKDSPHSTKMKFVLLLAVVGFSTSQPIGDIEYSYIDSTGRLINVEVDSDDLLYRTAPVAPTTYLQAAHPQPLSYMGVGALPAATTRVLATPYTQYTQSRYVYVDEDDLDDDDLYLQVAQPAAPSVGVMAYSAPAPAPAVATAHAMPLAAAPVPTLKAVAMPGQIQVVHKYEIEDDDDSAEK